MCVGGLLYFLCDLELKKPKSREVGLGVPERVWDSRQHRCEHAGMLAAAKAFEGGLLVNFVSS